MNHFAVGLDGFGAVRFSGEMDMATSPALVEAVAGLDLPEADRVVVDLSECTFIDSSGIHALLRAGFIAQERGTTLVLRSPGPGILRLLDLVGLDGEAPFVVEP